MAVFFDIDYLPRFKNAVITIGTFDGVHKGHEAIIREVVTTAERVQGESIIITFEPHPRKLLNPGANIGLITPLFKKLQLIHAAGIHHVVVVPFTEVFGHMKASDYVTDFLVGRFHPHTIIIGYDHRFGHGRSGNIDLMKALAPEHAYEVVEIPRQIIDEAVVSSTKIRLAIKEGKMADVTSMLGRFYELSGVVIRGRQLGREIGFPTANLQPSDPDQAIPATGVYAIHATVGNISVSGMMNIGYNPTVSGDAAIKIEAHFFDFNRDIYGETVSIAFVEKIRDEVKFASLDDLKLQIMKDQYASKSLLKYPN